VNREGRPRVFIAGVGNVFLGDDAFGVRVVKQLEEVVLPSWVRVADYGISRMRLASDLSGGYDTTILIDATPRGEPPGTVYLIEAETTDEPPDQQMASPSIDAHGVRPEAVLRLLRLLGGDAGRVLVVGCEPASTTNGIGLSPPVEAAIPEAVRLVSDLAWGARPRMP
jgi:hydrogenase maturation protease